MTLRSTTLGAMAMGFVAACSKSEYGGGELLSSTSGGATVEPGSGLGAEPPREPRPWRVRPAASRDGRGAGSVSAGSAEGAGSGEGSAAARSAAGSAPDGDVARLGDPANPGPAGSAGGGRGESTSGTGEIEMTED